MDDDEKLDNEIMLVLDSLGPKVTIDIVIEAICNHFKVGLKYVRPVVYKILTNKKYMGIPQRRALKRNIGKKKMDGKTAKINTRATLRALIGQEVKARRKRPHKYDRITTEPNDEPKPPSKKRRKVIKKSAPQNTANVTVVDNDIGKNITQNGEPEAEDYDSDSSSLSTLTERRRTRNASNSSQKIKYNDLEATLSRDVPSFALNLIKTLLEMDKSQKLLRACQSVCNSNDSKGSTSRMQRKARISNRTQRTEIRNRANSASSSDCNKHNVSECGSTSSDSYSTKPKVRKSANNRRGPHFTTSNTRKSVCSRRMNMRNTKMKIRQSEHNAETRYEDLKPGTSKRTVAQRVDGVFETMDLNSNDTSPVYNARNRLRVRTDATTITGRRRRRDPSTATNKTSGKDNVKKRDTMTGRMRFRDSSVAKDKSSDRGNVEKCERTCSDDTIMTVRKRHRASSAATDKTIDKDNMKKRDTMMTVRKGRRDASTAPNKAADKDKVKKRETIMTGRKRLRGPNVLKDKSSYKDNVKKRELTCSDGAKMTVTKRRRAPSAATDKTIDKNNMKKRDTIMTGRKGRRDASTAPNKTADKDNVKKRDTIMTGRKRLRGPNVFKDKSSYKDNMKKRERTCSDGAKMTVRKRRWATSAAIDKTADKDNVKKRDTIMTGRKGRWDSSAVPKKAADKDNVKKREHTCSDDVNITGIKRRRAPSAATVTSAEKRQRIESNTATRNNYIPINCRFSIIRVPNDAAPIKLQKPKTKKDAKVLNDKKLISNATAKSVIELSSETKEQKNSTQPKITKQTTTNNTGVANAEETEPAPGPAPLRRSARIAKMEADRLKQQASAPAPAPVAKRTRKRNI